jgi:hypothetical protein
MVSTLARAWTSLGQAGSLRMRARASFVRKQHAPAFLRFSNFVDGFALDTQRCLRADEPQSVADDAVLLGLLEAGPMAQPNGFRPTLYRIALGYRRCKARPVFREWLAIHEPRLPANALRAR